MTVLALVGLLVAVVTATSAPPAHATPAPLPVASAAPAPAAAMPRFMYLPDEEHWHALCTAKNRSGDRFDPLKCISLAHDPHRYLTLGGELRLKYEHFFNKDWNASNSGYLLERELINLDRDTSVYGAYARYLTGPFLRQSPQSGGVPSVSTAYYNLWLVMKF